jgi:hypothetical protein
MSKSSRAQQALPSTIPTLLAELGAGIRKHLGEYGLAQYCTKRSIKE